jgi:hypothetical protein
VLTWLLLCAGAGSGARPKGAAAFLAVGRAKRLLVAAAFFEVAAPAGGLAAEFVMSPKARLIGAACCGLLADGWGAPLLVMLPKALRADLSTESCLVG